eukprot:6209944-Pleurochrysis_carterae.AAC.1
MSGNSYEHRTAQWNAPCLSRRRKKGSGVKELLSNTSGQELGPRTKHRTWEKDVVSDGGTVKWTETEKISHLRDEEKEQEQCARRGRGSSEARDSEEERGEGKRRRKEVKGEGQTEGEREVKR